MADSPEGAPEAAAPEPEAEAPTEAAEGEHELSIAELPEKVQAYIKELREEAKGYRKQFEPFKKAFDHFNQAEQEYLVNMVDALGVNQEAGAQAMLDLSQRLLGIQEATEEAAADPEVVEEAEKAGLTEKEYREIVRQELQQEQLMAQIEQETISVGFTPGTPEANKLWDVAVAMGEPDLAKVAPVVRQILGLPEPAAAEEPAAEEAEEPATGTFPITAGLRDGTAGLNAGEPAPPPAIKSEEMRERIRRRIMAEAGS